MDDSRTDKKVNTIIINYYYISISTCQVISEKDQHIESSLF